MPGNKSNQHGRIAGNWLTRRPSGIYYRTWFNPTTRQTCRASLGTRDSATAERALAQFVAQNVPRQHEHPRDASLGRIFIRYESQHGQHIIGAKAQRRSLAMVLRHVPEGMTVAEFTLDAQRQSVLAMQRAGYGAGTIKRAIGAAKAAVNWAWANGELDRPVPFIKVEEGQGRERVLSISELAQLWSTEMPDHVRAFFATALATAARPEAALQLTRSQCDLDRGTINLNPPGRMQTKKRRPTLPMPKWYRPWVTAAKEHIISYRGKPVKKIAGAFQTMRDLAGFGFDVTAYTIRHSIATEMAARGVPELEIAAILGHRMPNSRTTGRYIHFAPDRLASARKALEDIATEIGRLAARPMAPTNVRATCVSPTHVTDTGRSKKPWKTGAAVGTGNGKSLARRADPGSRHFPLIANHENDSRPLPSQIDGTDTILRNDQSLTCSSQSPETWLMNIRPWRCRHLAAPITRTKTTWQDFSVRWHSPASPSA